MADITPTPAPIRTPMFDAHGNVTRAWQAYWKGQSQAVIDTDNAISVNGAVVPLRRGNATQGTAAFKGDNLSVKMFGAVGDGVTDDTAAIQAGIDYCLPVQASLFVPPGNYITSSTLNIDGVVGLTIYGEGGNLGATITYTGTGIAMRVRKSAGGILHRVTLRNINIVSSHASGAVSGLSLESVDESLFDGLVIGKSGAGPGFATGVYASGINISHFRRCIFSDNAIGLNFDANGTTNNSNSITGSNFYNNSTAHIKLGYATSLTIADNWLEWSPVGILQNNSTPDNTSITANIRVTGNHFQLAASPYSQPRGISIRSTNNANIISAATWVVRNNLMFVGVSGAASYAIDVLLSGNTVAASALMRVEDCLLWGVGTSGVYSDTQNGYFRMSDNDVRVDYFSTHKPLSSGLGKYVQLDQGATGNLDLVSGVFRSMSAIQAGDDAVNGSVAMTTGTPAAPGYLQWLTAAGVIVGKMGGSPTELLIQLVNSLPLQIRGIGSPTIVDIPHGTGGAQGANKLTRWFDSVGNVAASMGVAGDFIAQSIFSGGNVSGGGTDMASLLALTASLQAQINALSAGKANTGSYTSSGPSAGAAHTHTVSL